MEVDITVHVLRCAGTENVDVPPGFEGDEQIIQCRWQFSHKEFEGVPQPDSTDNVVLAQRSFNEYHERFQEHPNYRPDPLHRIDWPEFTSESTTVTVDVERGYEG